MSQGSWRSFMDLSDESDEKTCPENPSGKQLSDAVMSIRSQLRDVRADARATRHQRRKQMGQDLVKFVVYLPYDWSQQKPRAEMIRFVHSGLAIPDNGIIVVNELGHFIVSFK